MADAGGLLPQLAIGAAMVALTVMIHLLGLTVLLRLAGHHVRNWRSSWLWFDQLAVTLLLVLGLFAIHGFEIWIYAALFRLVGAAQDWEQALFTSSGAYSTAFLQDDGPMKHWRVVESLEAVNGLLLLGWSTAFLFKSLDRALVNGDRHPLPRGVMAEGSD